MNASIAIALGKYNINCVYIIATPVYIRNLVVQRNLI